MLIIIINIHRIIYHKLCESVFDNVQHVSRLVKLSAWTLLLALGAYCLVSYSRPTTDNIEWMPAHSKMTWQFFSTRNNSSKLYRAIDLTVMFTMHRKISKRCIIPNTSLKVYTCNICLTPHVIGFHVKNDFLTTEFIDLLRQYYDFIADSKRWQIIRYNITTKRWI